MKSTEHAEQVALCDWASRQPFNGRKIGSYMFAVPNAGKRSMRLAQYMRAEGLRAGVPDLMLAIPTPEAAGLFIEMKKPDGKGKLSEAQEGWLEKLQGIGYATAVCNTFEEARSAIEDYLQGRQAA